jgi:phage repressor protein C with HTH and peptisase S24 domain
MDTNDPRASLMALATRDGVSLSALSDLIGRNAAYLQQYVKRGTPRELDREDRRRLADYFGVDEAILGAEAGPRSFAVPRLDVAASAGGGAYVDGEVLLGTEMIDPALAARLRLREGKAGVIRVRGSSMEPGLLDGDMIVVDLARRVPGMRGEPFVIQVDGVTMVKRVRADVEGLAASSDNPDAPPIPDGSIAVIGKVVWMMREPR